MRRFFAALLISALAQPALAEPPKAGTIAPDLAFTELLQAPDGAMADWPSLHGKAVVLTFWATWCVPCVAESPLLNALAASVDPAKVQFIGADFNGEDPKRIEAFLKKHPISAWIGIDPAKETQRRFGVHAIPITLIIGPDGRVAHVTDHPETLKAEQLAALAEGQTVMFGGATADAKLQAEQKKLAAQAEKEKLASFKASNGRTLASAKGITLSETARPVQDGLPADLVRKAVWTSGRFDLLSARLQDLAAEVTGIPAARVTLSGISSEQRYNLHVDRPGADQKTLESAVAAIISSGLHVKIERRTVEKEVLILTAAPEASRHLDGPGAQADHYCLFMPVPPDKALLCAGGSLNALAEAAQDALGTPVVNETDLTGSVTTTLPLPSPDLASLSKVMAEGLGFALTPAKRSIEMVMVSAAP